MGITRPLATALHAALLASVAVLATGCMSGVRADIDASMREARAELHDDPLDLRADGRPDAAITPRGVFEIGGKPVPTDAAQQAAVRAYRDAMIAYGDAVLDVAARETGPLVSRSLRHAWFGVLTGREAAADRRIDADSAALEAKVRATCPQVARAKAAQDALADALPAFRPYARLDAGDIAVCRS